MNWEAIGAIGEIVGAAAVVITLIYLTTQVRQNTRQLASASLQGLADRAENRVLLIASNSEFAGVLAKLQRDPQSLSDTEVIQLAGWHGAWLTDLEETYRQFKLGIVKPATMAARARFYVSTVEQQTLLRSFWDEAREFNEPDFVNWLEQQLSD